MIKCPTIHETTHFLLRLISTRARRGACDGPALTCRPRSATHKLLTALASKSAAGKGFDVQAVGALTRIAASPPAGPASAATRRSGACRRRAGAAAPPALDDILIAHLRAAFRSAEAAHPAAPYAGRGGCKRHGSAGTAEVLGRHIGADALRDQGAGGASARSEQHPACRCFYAR